MIAPSTAVVPLSDWAVERLLFFSVSSRVSGDDQVEPVSRLARDRDVVCPVFAGHEVIDYSQNYSLTLGRRVPAGCRYRRAARSAHPGR